MPVKCGEGMSQGKPGAILAEVGKLAQLMGITLKILALWMYNYCPKLPKLGWNVVIIQKWPSNRHACLLLPY